jgi:MerR family transcriptional regulator, copper efflux regulator
VVLSITAAARQLRTTPRMLRYREALGLLPADREPRTHRRYDEESLRAAAYAIMLEQSYDVTPSALAFALRALTDPVVNSDVRRLSELTGPGRAPLAVLDFEQQKARRLLRPSLR